MPEKPAANERSWTRIENKSGSGGTCADEGAWPHMCAIALLKAKLLCRSVHGESDYNPDTGMPGVRAGRSEQGTQTQEPSQADPAATGGSGHGGYARQGRREG